MFPVIWSWFVYNFGLIAILEHTFLKISIKIYHELSINEHANSEITTNLKIESKIINTENDKNSHENSIDNKDLQIIELVSFTIVC